MANVGTATAGKVLTATGLLSSSTFQPLGTNSGLTDNGVIIGGGNGPLTSTTALTNGQVVIGATGSDPVAASITSTGGTITFTPGSGTLNMEAGGGSVATTYTTDSGNATPAAGVLNVLGRSGSKISASGATVTVKSPPYADAGASATSSLNTGEFVTGAYTRTLPASAGLADGDLIEYVCTSASALVIQAVGAQTIRLGSSVSSAAGTATSTAIGDSISLRFRSTNQVWYATSAIGLWTLA